MIYNFLLISDEVDNFARKIAIDSEATFMELHHAILKSVGYTTNLMTSFAVCSEDWEKETEITLEKIDFGYDQDNHLMNDTVLSEMIDEEGQRLIYTFDNMTERAFFMELKEIEPGKSLAEPICTLSKGTPPAQEVDFESFNNTTSNFDNDESFYGDEDYDMDELDSEGFDIMDPDSNY